MNVPNPYEPSQVAILTVRVEKPKRPTPPPPKSFLEAVFQGAKAGFKATLIVGTVVSILYLILTITSKVNSYSGPSIEEIVLGPLYIFAFMGVFLISLGTILRVLDYLIRAIIQWLFDLGPTPTEQSLEDQSIAPRS